MKSKIMVLGAGRVGSAIAIELSNDFEVTIGDFNEFSLEKVKQKCPKLRIQKMDVSQKEILLDLLQEFSLVVCTVPGFLGFQTLKTIIEAGKDVVDISFFPEDAFALDQLAMEKQVTAIVDCGLAPGMGNFMLGYHNEQLEITHFECLVGGLPKIKKWPFYYKAPFSPVDVIEEYTRPARFIENGHLVVREALSDCELIEFEKVGTLEAFNSDGLRSLIQTMPHILNMKEKTLRYPGHVDLIKALKASGFLSLKPLKVKNQTLIPRDVTSEILFKEWQLGENEEELTVMKIVIKGTDKSGQSKVILYDLYDEFCPLTETSSMARTTAYTATAAVQMIHKKLFNQKGIFPPEWVGKYENCFLFLMDYLKERGVDYRMTSN